MFDGKNKGIVKINYEDGLTATGLCGDCNGKKDDYRLQNGTDVSNVPKSNRDQQIGDSYWIDTGVDDHEE